MKRMTFALQLIWLLFALYGASAYGGLQVQLGHSERITSLAATREGILISGGVDGQLRFWSASTVDRRELRVLQAHISAGIADIKLFDDQMLIASAASNGEVAIWKVETGSLIQRFACRDDERALISEDAVDRSLLVVCADGKLMTWSSRERLRETNLLLSQAQFRYGQIQGTKKRLITSQPFASAVVHAVDQTSNFRLTPTMMHISLGPVGATDVAVQIVKAGDRCLALRVSVASGATLSEKRIGDDACSAEVIAFSDDGSRFVTSGRHTGDVLAWDMTTKTGLSHRWPVTNRNERWRGASALTFSSDGRKVYAALPFGRIEEFDYFDQKRYGGSSMASFLGGDVSIIHEIAVNPINRSRFAVAQGSEINVWDVRTARKLTDIGGHTAGVISVTWLRDGRDLVSGDLDGLIIRHKLTATGSYESETVARSTRAIRAVTASASGMLFAATIADNGVAIFDAKTGQLRGTCQVTGAPTAITFTSDGTVLMIATEKGNVTWCGTSNYSPRRNVFLGNRELTSIAISTNQTVVFVGDDGGSFSTIDFSSGRVLSSRKLCTSWVNRISTSPNDDSVVVGCDDGAVLVVNSGGATQRVALPDIVGGVRGLGFLHSRDELILGGVDRVLRYMRWTGGQYQQITDTIDFGVFGGGLVALQTGHFMQIDEGQVSDRLIYRFGERLRDVVSLDVLYDVFYRPDLVRRKLAGEDIRPYIGDLTIEKALQNPPPKVSFGTAPGSATSARLKIPYTIAADKGGIAEVRAFHNGKLVMSDGTYKDAVGRTSPAASAGRDSNRVATLATLRSAIPLQARSASATEGVAPLLTPVKVSVGGAPGNGDRPADLIVRSAPEKKCNPCTGEIEVDVVPGEENTITVVAFNRDNTIQSLPASVTFKSTLPKEEPKLWVLAVGIDRFKDIGSLKNARKDAADFACTYAGKQAMQTMSKAGINAPPSPICDQPGSANGLFKPENINVIDVQLDDKATKGNILDQLDAVAKRAKPQDTFVWFVASHGMMDSNGLFGIIAHDTKCLAADPATQACTQLSGHITSNEILEASKQIKAMKQLMVLDTCHSGGLDNKLSGLYDARMSVLAKNMGLHLYASAQATEAAQDGIPGTNGAFTAQLLAGIKGAAKQDASGNISIVSLGEYAKQKTIEATQVQPKVGAASNLATAKAGTATQTPVIQHFGVDAPLARAK